MIQFGLLGAGRFAQRRLLPLLSNFSHAHCVALHNRSLVKAKELAHTFQINFATNVEKDLIDYEGLDALIICSPNYLHASLIKKALAKGLAVYVEKPFTLSYAQAQEIQTLFPHGSCYIGHCYRFKPALKEAKNQLLKGTIGALKHIELHMHMNIPRTGWRFTKRYGGGARLELGSHLVDTLHYLTGQFPSAIQAHAEFIKDDHQELIDSSIQAIGRLPNGCSFNLSASFNLPYSTGFTLHGEKGRLLGDYIFRAEHDSKETLSFIDTEDQVHSIEVQPQNIHTLQLDAFFNQVTQGQPFGNALIALETMRTLDEIEKCCIASSLERNI